MAMNDDITDAVLGKVSEFYKQIFELNAKVMNMIDKFALDDYILTHTPRTPNGVDVCPKCHVKGLYSEPHTDKSGSLSVDYKCELCGYMPYADY